MDLDFVDDMESCSLIFVFSQKSIIIEENASESDTQPYLEYVEQFCGWEKGVVDQLKDLRNSIAKQPVAPEPELPTVDLDTQLNMCETLPLKNVFVIFRLLERVDAPQFILAFMTMAQKDPSFLKKAFEVGDTINAFYRLYPLNFFLS